MKAMRTLVLLSSAATLSVAANANAADLPVKAAAVVNFAAVMVDTAGSADAKAATASAVLIAVSGVPKVAPVDTSSSAAAEVQAKYA